MTEEETIRARAIVIGARRMTTSVIGVDQSNKFSQKPIIDHTVTYKMWLYGTLSVYYYKENDLDDLKIKVDQILYSLAEDEILSEKKQSN